MVFDLRRHYVTNRRFGGGIAESLRYAIFRPFVVLHARFTNRWRRRQQLEGEYDSIYGLDSVEEQRLKAWLRS
jgi:hypothetical protein